MVSVKLERQEKYNLTWHNYSDHYKQILRDLITTNNFSDVTLVTEDKQQIKAHKNIIGSCSPVFRNILQIDPFWCILFPVEIQLDKQDLSKCYP